MSDQVAPAAASVDAERLAALRELAYGASHEINNPLANISARAQALLRDEPDPERRRTLESIQQQALRAHEMISDLMLFARPPALALEPVCLASLVRRLGGELLPECRRRGVRLDLDLPAEGLVVDGDPEQLAEAVRALLVNALEASSPDERITATVTLEASESGGTAVARIEVADQGRGLSPRELVHAFDPFFSGREAGRGLGFGLPKCWRIVTAHGGDVALAAAPTGGVAATLRLPCG
ncbi:MAG: HAMP domain-containing histidine kinase [Pirellulales bacterium]|nr:HAMP domain-containing histidine kinase [Pirellulales bacterium]